MLQFIVYALLLNNCYAANILFISLQSTPSAHLWNEALVEGLLLKGHKIVLLGHTETKAKHENYTVLLIKGVRNVTGNEFNASETAQYSSLENILWQWKGIFAICEHDFSSRVMQDFLRYPKDSFDLIVIDINNGQCYYPLIDHFDTPPTISLSSFGVYPFLGDIIGHNSYAYYPFYTLEYSDRMTFFERVHNVAIQSADSFLRWFYMKKANKMAREFFGENARRLEEIETNITLLFTNSDPVLDFPQPLPPNVIPVGGIHIKEPKPLDKEMRKFFEEAQYGVIYFSMGTNILNDNIDDHVRTAFTDALSRVNQTVLWNIDNYKLNVSRNVIIRKWYPQNDILAQPKLKLFISHCGRLGGQEAINYGVPIIGVPTVLDTTTTCAKIKSVKGGVVLNYMTLTADAIYNAIVEVLENPEYKQNMMRLSKLYKEQPYTAIERAVLWTEYIIKTGHADHLSTAGRFMKFYEVSGLDVLICFSIMLLVICYGIHKGIMLIPFTYKMFYKIRSRKDKLY